MALTVEDGSGLAGADSYISLADADTYVAAHENEVAWTGAADAAKEKALRLGTQFIDLKYGRRFVGYRASASQALMWPRNEVVSDDGYSYESDDIPAQIGHAAVEAALRSIAGDTFMAPQTKPGDIKRTRDKVGPLESEVEYVSGQSQAPSYPLINKILSLFLVSTMRITRA